MSVFHTNNHWTNKSSSLYTHLSSQNHTHRLPHTHTHTIPLLTSHGCMPAHTSHSQRLCVTYVPHSVGGANSLPSVNKLTVSAPVPHSTPLGKSHPLTRSHPTALCCKACWVYGSLHRSLRICHLLAATVYVQRIARK